MIWDRRMIGRTGIGSVVVFVVSLETTLKAECGVRACERCEPTADIPFRTLLARVCDAQADAAEYFLPEPAHCPHCKSPILEETLVETA